MGRLVTTWVIDALKLRGFPVPDQDVLRECLRGLDDAQHEALRGCVERTRRGGESESDAQVAEALGRGARPESIGKVMALTGVATASEAMEWMLKNPDWQRQTQGVEMPRPDEQGDSGKAEVKSVAASGSGQARKQPRKGAKTLGSFPDAQQGHIESVEPGEGDNAHKVFGKTAKMNFELDIASGSEDKRRRYTIRIEATHRPKAQQGLGERVAEAMEREAWKEKIIFQLTVKELHEAVATIVGAQSKCSFRSHGENKDKRCEIRAQAGGLVVSVSQGERSLAVPIDGETLYPLMVMCCRALFKNDPDMDQKVLLDLVRLSAKAGRDAQSS